MRPLAAAVLLLAMPVPASAATLSGRLRVPRGGTQPAAVTARVQPSQGTAIVPADVACELEGTRFTCSVPPGALDVRIDPSGYVPHYLWNVDAAADTDLGELALTRGGTLSGRVLVGDRGTLDGVTVTVFPTRRADSRDHERRLALARSSAAPNAKGFFRLTGLAPGAYDVVATKDGWSTARLFDVRIGESDETTLPRPLPIEPLRKLEVLITPPLDPDGKPWLVSLAPAPAGREASAGGVWESAGLEDGTHELIVRDQRKVVYVRRRIEVNATTGPVALLIEAVAVRGQMTVGGEPVRTEVTFSDDQGRSVQFRSGSNGNLEGVLPAEGAWRAAIKVAGANTIRRKVTIRRRLDESFARVAIDLPSGRLEGKVVDANGAPVRATVFVSRPGEGTEGETPADDDGRFSFAGIDEGEVLLSARSRSALSDVVPARVTKEPGEPVTIVMHEKVTIRGHVRNPAGRPVAGAIVRWIAPGGMIGERITGPAGDFSFDAAGFAPVDVLVLPPDGPLRMLSVAAAEPIEITVGGPSGLLEVLYGESGRWPVIRGRSGFVGLHALRLPGGTGNVPRDRVPHGLRIEIEPGTYTVCADPAARANCVTRVVDAGMREVIDTRPLLR